jgi:hypothetical protein
MVNGILMQAGIPIPPNPSSAIARAVIQMQIGESFLCDSEKEMERARQAAARYGIKICRRKIPGEGWRVWRVA